MLTFFYFVFFIDLSNNLSDRSKIFSTWPRLILILLHTFEMYLWDLSLIIILESDFIILIHLKQNGR